MKKLMAVLLALCLIIGMMPMMALADGGADGSDNMQQTYDLHDKEGDGSNDEISSGNVPGGDAPLHEPTELTEPTKPETSSSPTDLDALDDAITAVEENGTVELGDNILGDVTINNGKNFTIDGADKAINGDVSVTGSGVVLKNLTVNGTLTVTSSSVTVMNCKISDYGDDGVAIKVTDGSVVTVYGSKLEAETQIIAPADATVVAPGFNVYPAEKPSDPEEDEDFEYTDDEETIKDHIAFIGDTYYDSLEDAVEAANRGETIRLLESWTMTTNAALGRGVTLVVTGGATLTIPSSVTFTNNGRIENYGTVKGYTANRPVLTSLSFTVAPGSADIELYRYWRGELDPVNREGNSYLVPNGDYRYVISASGYETEYGDVTVSGSERIILVQLDENDTHRVYVEPTVNGDLSVDEVWAEEGEWVYITVKPDAGYRLDELTVTRPSGNEVKVYHVRDNVFRFKMPGVRVTVDAEFVRSSLPFSDVSRGQWFYDYVAWAYNTGLMEGVSAGRFAPNSTTTRAMVVTIIYRLAGSPGVSGTSDFTDVPAGAWYSDAVTWAAKRGIVEGMTATTFDPNDAVTREELAAMLYRYAKHKGYDTSAAENTNILSYNDALSISEYAFEALQWACGEGIINGTGGGSLEPGGSATRAQLAAMLYRFCNEYFDL